MKAGDIVVADSKGDAIHGHRFRLEREEIIHLAGTPTKAWLAKDVETGSDRYFTADAIGTLIKAAGGA